jgi:predicted O-methyltransferase YrrM
LIPDDLRQNHRLVVGDAMAGIASAAADHPIDMFIHDSDHRYDHESAEFEAAIRVAGRGAVLISDNAHASTAFSDFCARHGLRYRYWHEEPRGHFYPGAGIGMAIAGDDGG